MFEGFQEKKVKANGLELYMRMGGSGPPLVLLHGYPQSHIMWHKVAPELANHFSVYVFDLPGYGESEGPPLIESHLNHSKRETAKTISAAMAQLGHESFNLAGHDRGARVAYRLALDHPETAERLALLDIIPTLSMWEHADGQFAAVWFHWGFLAQGAPFPETMIAADPDTWLEYCLGKASGDTRHFDSEAIEAYRTAFHKFSVIEASCEDYRAGATVDPEYDRQDRAAGRKIDIPTLLLWGNKSIGNFGNDVCLELWKQFVEAPEYAVLNCGHFLPEEASEDVSQRLIKFFNLD